MSNDRRTEGRGVVMFGGMVLVGMGSVCVFFFNDTATTEIYTLSLHDALPISDPGLSCRERTHNGSMGLISNQTTTLFP